MPNLTCNVRAKRPAYKFLPQKRIVLDSFKQDTFSHGTRKKTKKELEKEEEERKRKEEEVLVLETFDHAPVVLRSVKGVGDRNDFLIPYCVFTRI
jgi:hypothetical protein